MKVRVVLLLVVALVVLAFPAVVFAGFQITPRIMAGQSQIAGFVPIRGEDGTLTLTFMLKGGAGWCMTESQVHVAASVEGIPQNNGGATPGQFDHKHNYGGCVTSDTYEIEVPELDGQTVYIAIHAVVIGPDGQQETGWAVNCGNLEGQQFPGSNWSAYIVFPANAWY